VLGGGVPRAALASRRVGANRRPSTSCPSATRPKSGRQIAELQAPSFAHAARSVSVVHDPNRAERRMPNLGWQMEVLDFRAIYRALSSVRKLSRIEGRSDGAVHEFLIVTWIVQGAVLYQHELRCAPVHRRPYDAT
jgi:hypothetical protein